MLVHRPEPVAFLHWDYKHEDAAFNLKSVVTFTAYPDRRRHAPSRRAGRVRTEQKQAFGGAHAGWKQFLDKLDAVVAEARIEGENR